jgi:hypothetical protein
MKKEEQTGYTVRRQKSWGKMKKLKFNYFNSRVFGY